MNLDSSRTKLKSLLLVRVIHKRDRYFLNRPDLVIFSTSSNLLKMVSKVSALNSSFSSNRLMRLRRSVSVAAEGEVLLDRVLDVGVDGTDPPASNSPLVLR